MRSESKILLQGKCGTYYSFSEEERSKLLQAYFDQTLMAIGDYILITGESA
ncbi:hypothetical protein [Desulfitobacterium sp.]|uniref:hypothetical protein n=1 Tax=Desulfitobacterium sp. TaxID=49981 RepID=UPI002B1FA738|nr:hypothetical protein [Desulfitobacterium sp.]MEA4902294.1 hypothetical protein [Desulfitobacterium sp.]